jgi:SprT-like family
MNTRAVRRSNAELQDLLRSLFLEFNKRFFGGTLPEYEVRVILLIAGKTIITLRNGKNRPLPNGNDLYGICLGEEQQILIDSRCTWLQEECVREVLLHEMCHAAVYRISPTSPGADPHGQDFVGELRRLAALGEVWANDQVRYYQTVPLARQAQYPIDAWRAARNG